MPFLELLLRERTGKGERLTRPLFGSGQTLRILLENVKDVRVKSYDPSAHAHELDLSDATQQHVNLSTTLFGAQAAKGLNPMLAKFNSFNSRLRITEVRALHHAKGLPCGWFIASSTIPKNSLNFKKESSSTKIAGAFSDLSGKAVGTLEWNDLKLLTVKIDSEIQLLFSDVNYILNGEEFSFDPASSSVICLTIGTRIVTDLGCYTLVGGVEDGRYIWKADNSVTVHGDLTRWTVVRTTTFFSYLPGANLIVLGDSKHSEQWIPVTVVGRTAFNTHTLQCLDGSTMSLDLNDFNHTWREVCIDGAGGYAGCIERHKAHVEAQFRHVEDAITGRKLVVRDQLLHLKMLAGDSAKIQTQIVDVQSLIIHLLSTEQRQSRHKGMFKPLPVLIMAAPGSGKTWTIWQLMYLLAVEPTCPEKVCLSPVVIFVQILAGLIRKYDPELHQCRVGFVEFYVRKTCEKRTHCGFLLQAYRMRTLIIAVDGIDEAGGLRDSIVELVMEQLVDGGHTCVLTSRPEGVQRQNTFVNRRFSEFVVLDLAPLTQEQQDRAIRIQLKDNDFYNHLRQFSEVRLCQDQLYESFPLEHRRKIEALTAPDLFFAAEGRLDPLMRQWSTCGKLIQTVSCVGSASLTRRPEQLQMLNQLAGKLSIPPSQLWAQIVADCDELYQVAELALPHIHKGIEQMLVELKIPLEQLSFASLKNPIRVYEKARDDYVDRFNDQVPATACVCDVVRGRVLCGEMSELGMILETLVDRPPPWLRVIRMKNKFKDVDAARFRNIHLNLLAVCCGSCGAVTPCVCGSSPTQHLFEIQLHHRRIFGLDAAMHAHDHYEFFRAINSIKVEDQLDFVINKQIELFSEISSSPVLLSLLILVLDRGDHRLPTSLFELYALALEAATQSFLNLRPQSDDGLREEVLGVVRQIAFGNHIAQRRTFGHLASNHPKFAIWNEICATGKNDTTVLSFIKVISQMELYQFSHMSFQEFFFLEVAYSKHHRFSLKMLITNSFYENALRIGVTNQAINNYLVPGPSLRLDPGTLSKAQADIVSDMLRVNTTLTKLDLPKNNITQLKHLESNLTLTTLCLPSNQLGGFGMRSLIATLMNHRSLVYLDLTDNGIEGHAAALGEALSHNTVLKTLVLAANEFEVADFARACLQTNTALTSLDLSGNKFRGVDEFCAALRANRGLKALYLNHTCAWNSWYSNLISAIDIGSALEIGLGGNQIDAGDAAELGQMLARLPSPHLVVRRILISNWIDLEAYQGEPHSLRLTQDLEDNDLAFLSAFLKPSLRGLELSCRITSVGLRYILDACGLTITDLKVHIRGLSSLLLLLPFLIRRNSHTHQLTVRITWEPEIWHTSMKRREALRVLVAIRSFDMHLMVSESKVQLPSIIIHFLLMSVFGLPIWQAFAGRVLVGRYWMNEESLAVCSLVFNGWLIWLPVWVSLGLIPFVWIWVYVDLLLVLLLCNSSNFKPYDWMPAQYYVGADVTLANLMSVSGLCVTTVQLSMLIFSSLFDLSNSLAFQVLMLHSPDASLNWLGHGILAGLLLGVGAEVLPIYGSDDDSRGKDLMHFFEAVYLSSFILPFIHVPMLFNLLIGLKSELQDDVMAGFTVVLAGFVVFSLCTGWAGIQLDYSGKQVLTSEAWFVNLDYGITFVLVFLAHTLSAYVEWFFWVALGLTLLKLGVIWQFRPFARTRGNILKASSSLVLCIVVACAIAASKVSVEWALWVAFGAVTLLVGLVCIALLHVKPRVTLVTSNDFANAGRDAFEMTQSKYFLPIAYFVEFLFILLVPIWFSECSGLRTWAIISDILLFFWVLVAVPTLRNLPKDLDVDEARDNQCFRVRTCACIVFFLALSVDFALGVWLVVDTACSPSLYMSSILLIISLAVCTFVTCLVSTVSAIRLQIGDSD